MEITEFVKLRKEALAQEIKAMERPPHLMIILANDDPASAAYDRGKMKDGAEIGAKVDMTKFSPDVSEEELLGTIERYNEDPSIDGIIVQLPLPKHISEDKVKQAVLPSKDVDGFHPLSAFRPCTPYGIILYLEHEDFSFRGKNAVVLGRSNIVGKPMAQMLLKKDCNVTVLHSKTSEMDKAFYLAHADLIVVAIGRQGFLDNRFSYKKDAVVVDVGINRGEDMKLHGDAIPNLPVAMQTPVPKGVGLLTRLALMENLVQACQNKK
ncbi:MAG: bifunctional 5,10-methylenetetrahydrofolate dehydrogenase/5,10-methenyltetrahydrofolate cyclohydrolase [Candidatus Enteromonas sp.]|nr:bifunctional 5,10-methylenetetrahydrofolate dehydrogenase/5,10-methenyltetrahydrofolate cyclohydrolase [bacterium]MDY6100688.1 bifunctional 5,10-methylenetetrahydrofolate dehydrogenase/5,10-methenyltetrahydrofolate cyclohydrolase [Candidatus Enteromonas sp.]